VTGLLAALVLASASGPTGAVDVAALEARAAEAVQGAFTAAKLPVPARDPALSLAARDISKLMATGSLSAAGLAEAVPAAISRAGGWDPAPRSVVLGGSSADGIVQYLRAQQSLTEDRADVFGVGISVQTGKLTLLVVTARRYATVSTFPRTLPVGGQAELAVTLRAPLRNPQLVVTAPDGRAETNSAAVAAGETLTAGLTFPAAGRYTIEVMGRGPEGPKVAALFGVTVGPVGKAMASDDGPEPKDPIAKIDAVLAHINRVRARAKAGPLVHDHNLDVLALEQAEDMATHHFFAHVSPTRGDLHQRLTGRYAYVRAGENLGEADGALAAERAIEGSPAHLENTLDPRFTHVGLALFPNRHPGGDDEIAGEHVGNGGVGLRLAQPEGQLRGEAPEVGERVEARSAEQGPVPHQPRLRGRDQLHWLGRRCHDAPSQLPPALQASTMHPAPTRRRPVTLQRRAVGSVP
jgi:hypothetical protein